ncbi:MAG: anti-sigma F factor [Lachnospiraceae bacterium]|nr:anti-sigma F factor [Lachnospiraceae bacterium]MBQ2319771.1 anti-sigma F factor [Lachnospiraceae bacterium]
MKIIFESCSENEAFARTVVASYMMRLNPTMEEIADVKTAVSEAVTNCIIHGYDGRDGDIEMECIIHNKEIEITIIDYGVGIPDIEKAMEPLYTTKPEWERSGMGFAFMEAFMDGLSVKSEAGKGTKVVLKKVIGQNNSIAC